MCTNAMILQLQLLNYCNKVKYGLRIPTGIKCNVILKLMQALKGDFCIIPKSDINLLRLRCISSEGYMGKHLRLISHGVKLKCEHERIW